MTSIKEKDYEHANERGNGPRARMEGGDLTDDIDINNPDSPLKKKITKAKAKDAPEPSYEELPYKKP